MASLVFEKLKQPVFNLFYIMTEGVQVEAGFTAYRKTVFLLFIDVLQVLRVMCSLRYGWTEDTQGVIEKTDLVYMFTTLVSKLIPRYSFFVLAAVLVLVALLDSYYVVKLFQAGHVQKLWPVKLLRFLVASLVTILFSSVIKWLLIPVECLVSEEKSFSQFVHNEEGLCTPWAMPEVLVSIPTILLAAAYIVFALGTSYLAFEINPLSRNPRAMHTGRVELLFAFNKVAVTLLVYISDLVTPVVVAIFFFFWTLHVFRQHLKILPYHSAVTNNVRGGIYGMVLWWSFSTLIVASIKISREDEWDTGDHPTWLQPLQWALAGLIPLAFVLGLSLTSIIQYRVGRSLNRLRGDFERPAETDMPSSFGKSRGTEMSAPGNIQVPRTGIKRGVFEKFFDTEWESRRRFAHEWRAGVLIRHLLHNRNIQDLVFMQYLVGKAIQEHPESTLLQLQLLVLHRFVFRDASEAAEIQRSLKLDQKNLPVDFQYILFVAERKSNQAMRGTDLGGGGAVTGIRLMEFDISFERARKAHMACVTKMRSFWRHVEKKRNASFDIAQATDLVKDLDEFEEQSAVAKKEYEILNEKYPQSVQLLRSYAHFCDTVLNDFKQAEAFQRNAALLEGEEEDEEDDNDETGDKASKADRGGVGAQDKEGGGSTYSSEAEPYRVAMYRYLMSHSEHMMGHEAKAVHSLHYRVGLALLLLLVIATSGFVLNDSYLFSGLALHNMDQIDKTGLLRSYALNTAFLLRSMQLASIYNSTKDFEAQHLEIVDMMETWRHRHRNNYEEMAGRLKRYYLKSELPSSIPVEGHWEKHTDNFWQQANEFARRSERAAHVTMEEMRNSSWRLGTMSYEKENVAYVYENLERQTRKDLRVVVNIFEEEMEQFGVLATALVICNVCVNALLVLLIAYFVLRALGREMRSMQSALVFCSLALALPRSTANTIFKYYDTIELNMKIVEDEEADRTAIMQSDTGTACKRRGSVTSMIGPETPSTSVLRRLGRFPDTDQKMLVDGNHLSSPFSPEKAARCPSIMRPSSVEAMPVGEASFPLTHEHEPRSETRDESGGSDGSQAFQPVNNVQIWLKAETRGRDEEGGGKGEGRRAVEGVEMPEPEGEGKGGGQQEEGEAGVGGSGGPAQAEESESDGEGEGRGVWGSEESRGDRPRSSPEHGQEESERRPGRLSDLVEGRIKRPAQDQWSRRSGRMSPRPRSPRPSRDGRGGRRSKSPEREDEDEARHRFSGRRSSPRADRGESAEEQSMSRNRRSSVSLMVDEEAEKWAALCSALVHAERAKLRNNIRKRKQMGQSAKSLHATGEGGRQGSLTGQGIGRTLWSMVLGSAKEVETRSTSNVLVDGRPENFIEESRESLAKVVDMRKPWHTRLEVYALVCAVVLGSCIFSMVYPSRHIDDLVNLAPTANQAGRRRSLASSCVHYSRELVLNDGLSRMDKGELAGALSFYLQELRDADRAVRLGGDKGVRVGSDYRNKVHNDVMYGEGCKWRVDPSDCTLHGFPGREDMTKHGLQYLIKSFEDAVDKVLVRYAPHQNMTSMEWKEHRPTVASPDLFAEVHTKDDRVKLLESDDDLRFIQAAFTGDVTNGLGKMLTIFHDETAHVLSTAQSELRLLFGLYVCAVGLLFYTFLFRRTIKLALSEVERARGLVMGIPSHVLKKESVHSIVGFFVPAETGQNQEEDAVEERAHVSQSPA